MLTRDSSHDSNSSIHYTHLEVALAVVPQEARLGKLLAALETLVRLLLVVAAQVFAEHLLVDEGAVARLAHVLPVLVGQEVLGGNPMTLILVRKLATKNVLNIGTILKINRFKIKIKNWPDTRP